MSRFITMTDTKKGSNNGISILEFEKDCTYEVSNDLAKTFCEDMNVARKAKPAEIELLKNPELASEESIMEDIEKQRKAQDQINKKKDAEREAKKKAADEKKKGKE